MESIQPMFDIGDVVRVKELETLKCELGESIDTPCHFIDQMYEYCGKELEVFSVHQIYNKKSYFYRLKNAGDWKFDECVLESVATIPAIDLDTISMNYEDLF